jgi:hypothetical protein
MRAVAFVGLLASIVTPGCNAILGLEEKALDDARICSDDGERCAPASGCSDGVRDGWKDIAAFPTIAGCKASWPKAAMDAPPTGKPCGSGLGACAVPADACAEGWHVCGIFGPDEVRGQLSVTQCQQEPGSFGMALGATSCQPCGSQPAACCGSRCVSRELGSCLYDKATGTTGVVEGFANVCNSTQSVDEAVFGVLCCFSRKG